MNLLMEDSYLEFLKKMKMLDRLFQFSMTLGGCFKTGDVAHGESLDSASTGMVRTGSFVFRKSPSYSGFSVKKTRKERTTSSDARLKTHMSNSKVTTTASRCRRRESATPVSPGTLMRRKSYLSSDRLVKTLKRDSLLRRRFESFASHQYAAESVAFVKSVLEWKSEAPGDVARARIIVDTYIREGSVMQVNISYNARVKVERALEEDVTLEGKVSVEMFDVAVREINCMMIEGGVWGSFVWKGGLDQEREASTSDDLAHALAQI